jgi:hypothetical protein
MTWMFFKYGRSEDPLQLTANSSKVAEGCRKRWQQGSKAARQQRQQGSNHTTATRRRTATDNTGKRMQPKYDTEIKDTRQETRWKIVCINEAYFSPLYTNYKNTVDRK